MSGSMSVIAQSLGGRAADPEEFPELQTLLARIEAACDPIDVILYGSRARGAATAQSDWDLKVIVSDDAPETLMSPLFGWRLQEGSGVHADVSVARLSDFQADLQVANSAASHIVDDGILLVR
ncbi:nucleotidyltransferase domain-containing protein [Rhizobium rosettiformans]|uniref:Nucleotidyltransferase domain-containing protein n=1 Tax=Rhizobium rosettiformans TaxID=1368430 RepID=A0ABX7EY90_9HYPH|nr:nucleotidyltransferase domain-containing protein [Rhizobium rosettiformans]QRF52397.1 nucleotidyltransferase domain-containing protein [Rhizobium rosettiformans]